MVGDRSVPVPDEAVSGQVIASLAPGATEQQLQQLLAATGATLKSHIEGTSLVVLSIPNRMSVLDGVRLLSGRSPLEFVEPDRVRYLLASPNDSLYAQQYHLPLIAAEAGWDVQQGSASMIVAVVDSGYDPDHEDLVDRYWQNGSEAGGTADVDDDGNGFVDDVAGWDFWQNDNDPDARPAGTEEYDSGSVSHGTHCAGIIGASTNNSLGVAGLDWNCKIMPVRVFGPLGSSADSMIIQGFQYAVANGADVINMSCGGGYSEAYTAPIAAAHAAGIIVVASAGNESWTFTNEPWTWMSPVCNDGPNVGVDNNVIGVAATDSSDMAAGFTNTDDSGYRFVDVSAPGVQVLSTYYHDPALVGNDVPYGLMSGTSMAAPVVSGLAALVKAQFGAYNANDVINQIRISADDITEQNPLIAGQLGTGRVNAAAALGLDVPPAPVTNLQARDTVGDEGGSITVSWEASDDDGKDVVGYTLLRASESSMIPNTPGSFSQLEQLPPGTEGYIDAPVPDDTPYWYQVITLDAANSVMSAVAGPASARDDLPPDPIENLVAMDTQADSGGSITVSWFGYSGPSDLAEFRLYREEASFTDVADLEPLVVLAPDDAMRYIDRTTVDGTEYWYAVTAVDDADNENTEVTAAGPAISSPNFAFSYPAGLSIISLGATPSDPNLRDIDDILGLDPLGAANLAYWDPSANQYVVWSDTPGSAVFTQELGRSWWLKTPQPILANISGQAAPVGDVQRQVVTGWNQLGNPFPSAIDFSITEVTGIGQGTPVSLSTSNELGYTRDYAWGYDSRTNSYKLIAGFDLPFATKTLDKGRGALFLSRRPATLLLKRPVMPTASAQEQASSFDGWALRLVAQAQEMADTDNFLGVCAAPDTVSGVVSPPRPDADLDLYFVRPAADGGRMATDFVAPEGVREWEVRVACAVPETTVRLSWPDLSELPGDIRPMLVDNATGRTIYLRTSTGYSYEVGDEPSERSFTIRIADAAGALAINTLSAGAAGGRGQIVYTLSQDASVGIEVLNIAGVTVRRIFSERAQSAGPQQVTWDGRNAAGSNVPAGTYLIRVTARSDDGQQVSAIRSLQLGR
jgi:subtilisin family serine protease